MPRRRTVFFVFSPLHENWGFNLLFWRWQAPEKVLMFPRNDRSLAQGRQVCLLGRWYRKSWLVATDRLQNVNKCSRSAASKDVKWWKIFSISILILYALTVLLKALDFYLHPIHSFSIFILVTVLDQGFGKCLTIKEIFVAELVDHIWNFPSGRYMPQKIWHNIMPMGFFLCLHSTGITQYATLRSDVTDVYK